MITTYHKRLLLPGIILALSQTVSDVNLFQTNYVTMQVEPHMAIHSWWKITVI